MRAERDDVSDAEIALIDKEWCLRQNTLTTMPGTIDKPTNYKGRTMYEMHEMSAGVSLCYAS